MSENYEIKLNIDNNDKNNNKNVCCNEIEDSIEKKHLECLKLLCNAEHGFDENILKNVALNGNLNIIKYLYTVSVELKINLSAQICQNVCSNAVRRNSFKFLKYFRENGFSWNGDVYTYSMDNSNDDCFYYAIENQCPFDEEVSAEAAIHNDVKYLKCLRENGCPWDTKTTHYAAEYGSLNCLAYAHQNGCPIDNNICSISISRRGASFDCLEYLLFNNCGNYKECKKLNLFWDVILKKQLLHSYLKYKQHYHYYLGRKYFDANVKPEDLSIKDLRMKDNYIETITYFNFIPNDIKNIIKFYIHFQDIIY